MDIRGLICIDLWESDEDHPLYPEEYHLWLRSLVSQFKEFNFDSIINAGYQTKPDYTDLSLYNTLTDYSWQDTDNEILLDLVKSFGKCTMSTIIKENLFGPHSFALHSVNGFLKHVNKVVPHIKDWLVVGCSWQRCTHYRGLGLTNLAKIKDLNFYGAEWGFYSHTKKQQCTSDDFKNDSLSWTFNNTTQLYKLNYDPR